MAASPKKKAAAKKAAPSKAAPKKAAPPMPTKARKLTAQEFAPLAPYLRVRGAKKAIEFYQKAFGAQVRMMMEADDKKRLMHADLIINGGELMLSDEFPEFGEGPSKSPSEAKTTTVSIHLQVDDADKWWKRALDAGAQVAMPLADQFWGDRFGQIKDPFGHVWSIASPVKKRK